MIINNGSPDIIIPVMIIITNDNMSCIMFGNDKVTAITEMKNWVNYNTGGDGFNTCFNCTTAGEGCKSNETR